MVAISTPVRKLRGRIAETGAKHRDLAAALRIHPSYFSHIIHERRRMPEGFEERVHKALDQMEREGSDG